MIKGMGIVFYSYDAVKNIKEGEDFLEKEYDDTDYPISIELAIVIKGGKLYIRDLFDLMDWTLKCEETQQMTLEDGIYDIVLNTRVPKSGIYFN